MTTAKQHEAADKLGRASIYMGQAYPFIKNDVCRQTPERRAAEILLALKDLIDLSTWAEIRRGKVLR